MPHLTDTLAARKLVGTVVGNGQCVALIHKVSTVPATSYWTQGAMVRGNHAVSYGTVIATFDLNGRYGNHTDHTSHREIVLYQNNDGREVLDKWKGQPVHERIIYFDHPRDQKVSQGEHYFLVE